MLPVLPNTPPNSLFWRIVHFPIVLLAIGIAFMVGAGFLSTMASRAIPHAGNGWLAIVAALAVAGIFILAYWLFTRFIERRETAEFARAGAGRELAAGLTAGVILFSVVIGIIALLGGYHVIGTHTASVLLPAIAISITSGVTEEIMVRGVIFRIVESWLGTWIALILSAALFGAAHLGNPNATMLAGSAIALEAGVMLAALYLLTRRLWAAIGLHAAWNFAQGGIYGVPVSGFTIDGILRPRIAGPTLLTGGDFGAEASLPAIIVCTLFGLAVLYTAWTHGRFVSPFWARRGQPAVLQE